MRRRPIPILLALALAVGLAPAAAQALPESAVVHEAATEDELVGAAAAVNADDTGAPQAIRLTGDIAFDGSSNDELVFTHDVTLLGGGHSIDLGSWGLVAQNGATLTLGESDGSDALVIKRTGSEPRIRPLIRLGSWSGAGTLDMYDGVELTGSIVNGAQMGSAVGIDHGTFNMHGGSIHGNENRSSAGMGGAVAGRSDSAAPVVVNISGGSIAENVSSSSGYAYNSPAVLAYQASYRFESATEGKQLPDEVAALLPTDDAVYGEGDTVNAVAPERDRVEADGGVWTFDGYDAASVKVDGAAPAFVGRWSWHASTPWTPLTPATPTDASGDGGAKGQDGKTAASKGLPKTGDAAWVGAAVAGVGAATVLAGVSILRPKRSRQR